MKILWVKTDYLHPTNRGGQIRTLEMLKRLHARHEVDYLTLLDPSNSEGPARAGEYCRRHFAVPHSRPAGKSSVLFVKDLIRGVWDELPVAISRWQSDAMQRQASALRAQERYDATVCDFLVPAASLDDWPRLILFQHNVEALIWERHAERAPTPLHRWYLAAQARKMAAFEGKVSQAVRRVICVSEQDAQLTATRYGRKDAVWVPTGVDTEYFSPPPRTSSAKAVADLIFIGSMDWLPNIDGAEWFASEILPLIWQKQPGVTVALVGRNPEPRIRALGQDSRIRVSGTVDDIRPWLHNCAVSIVPLRVGGGTRLKIYESMAGGVATVSTTVGAEGLDVQHGETILLADDPKQFAESCLQLLEDPGLRRRIADAALLRVRAHHSWEAVTNQFERYL